MKTRYLLLFLFSLVLSASGLAGLPPIDRDEARFVQSTKQMVETGDYVDIRLQETTRYKKPIGIYWLQSAAVQLSGQGAEAPIFVYRLVSALGVAHQQPGDTVELAAEQTGLDTGVLQEIIGQIGGEGSLGRFAQMVQQDGGAGILGALDRDGDGNPLNDLGGIAGSLFGKK